MTQDELTRKKAKVVEAERSPQMFDENGALNPGWTGDEHDPECGNEEYPGYGYCNYCGYCPGCDSCCDTYERESE